MVSAAIPPCLHYRRTESQNKAPANVFEYSGYLEMPSQVLENWYPVLHLYISTWEITGDDRGKGKEREKS
jgi:hypothetical protein